jgi:RNA polymerase sigma-70 factor (ECF subfamily)
VKLSNERCDELYRKHAPGAFRRAQRMLGSVSDADEVVHEVFLQLFERPSKQLEASRISAYLYGAVTHACLNRIRNRRTRARLVQQHQYLLPRSDPGMQPDAAIAARELIEQLPVPLATVAVYYYLDELSQREIAGILGCSHRHVGQLLMRLEHWVKEQEKAQC